MDEMCAACEVLDEGDDCPCLCHMPDRDVIGRRNMISQLVIGAVVALIIIAVNWVFF